MRARALPGNPQLPQPLLEELLPNLTLQFALVPDGEDTFPALTSLHIQRVEGAHAATRQPTRCFSYDVDLGFYRVAESRCPYLSGPIPPVPKGVLSLIPFGDHDDWLLSLPLFHVSGQGIMWRWLYAGARMTVRDKQPLEQMLAGCTHASLVPTQLWRLLVNRSSVSLKAVLLGGAAIPVELTEQAREQGIRCFCGYGLTEFASTVCAKEADGLADVGSPLPGRGSENR